ncbi:MAG TPA: ATP-binding protein [Polyangiaceae bacterium]|nr:ATP-binding protein [Polyangiaceae bacterium]
MAPLKGTFPGAAGMPISAPALTFAWLVRLRWGAIVAQAATVLLAVSVLNVPLNTPWLAAILAFTAATNAGLYARVRAGRSVSNHAIGAVLGTDTLLLTALLYLSGGPSNPFSILYLVYVTLGAVTLGIGWASAIVVVAATGYALLFVAAGPMDGMEHMDHVHHGSTFSTHLQAMWVAFTVAAALIAYFGSRVAHALRDREVQLAQAQRIAAKSETVASLSTLAAGAAHELGTPLATIAVAARELELGLRRVDQPALTADAKLIREALERCRRIVEQMSGRAGETMGEVPQRVSIEHLIGELRERARILPGDRLDVEVDARAPARVVVPVRGLVQAIASLLRNALDATPSEDAVRLHVLRDRDRLRFDVEDRGAGIPKDVLDRIGEPFFTTKPAGRGMGLGVFLANAFAERWHGRLSIQSEPGRGTRAVLEIPFGTAEEGA